MPAQLHSTEETWNETKGIKKTGGKKPPYDFKIYHTGRNEKNFVIDNPELLVRIGVHVVGSFTDCNASLVELSVAFLGSFPVLLVVDAIGDKNLNTNNNNKNQKGLKEQSETNHDIGLP